MLVPLGVSGFAATQVSGIQVRLPSTIAYADAGAAQLEIRRPALSTAAPPPTLAPAPTPILIRAVATATPTADRTYTVKAGDELKHIAADYGVNIWKIIEANDIPNPDSLTVGQVLRIPDG
jgi:LysM repeat protein